MAVAVLLLLVLVIIFGGGKKTDEEKIVEEREKMIENLTLEKIKNVPRDNTIKEDNPANGTGALYISPTRDEYDEIMAIRKIKDSSPIETNEFKVHFDYGSNLIVVDFTNKEDEYNMNGFENWKWNEGYGVIGDQYWKVNL